MREFDPPYSGGRGRALLSQQRTFVVASSLAVEEPFLGTAASEVEDDHHLWP